MIGSRIQSLIFVAMVAQSAHLNAATIRWVEFGAGTQWTNVNNWDLGRIPGTNDDVILNPSLEFENLVEVSGPPVHVKSLESQRDMTISTDFTVTESMTIRSPLTLDAGVLTAGDLQMHNTLKMEGGSLGSPATLIQTTLELDQSGGAAGEFIVLGTCAITGQELAPAQRLWIRGTAAQQAIAVVPATWSNNGTILLQSDHATTSSSLQSSVVPSRLVNGPGALLETIAAGTPPTLRMSILNLGEVRLGSEISFGGNFTNQATLLITNNASVNLGIYNFIQDSGSMIVLPGSQLTFVRAASNVGFNMQLTGGSLDADQILCWQGYIHLNGPAVDGDFAIIFEAGGNFISGTVGSGQTVWARGTASQRVDLQLIGSLTNNGTIRLQSDHPSNQSLIDNAVPSDILVNNPGGVFELFGTGESPSLKVDVHNEGLVTLASDINFGRSFTNNGTLLITNDASVILELPLTVGSGFFQDSGTLTVAPNASFAFGRASFNSFYVEFNGGTINADQILCWQGYIHLNGPAVDGDFAIIFEAGGNFISGTVGSGQTVWARGTASQRVDLQLIGSLTNNGTIRLQSDHPSNQSLIDNAVPSDILVNNPGGVFELFGTGESPSLKVDVHNEGLVTLASDIKFGRSFTNNGTLLITNNANVILELPATSGSGYFQDTGTLTVAPNASFAFGRASAISFSVEFNGGTINADQILSRQGAVHLNGPAVDGDFAIIFEAGGNFISGTVGSGQTVWARGTASQRVDLQLIGSLTNNGTIRLQSDHPSNQSLIDNAVPSDILVNNPGGVFELFGTGESPSLKVDVHNEGLVTLASDIKFGRSFTNNGTLLITNNANVILELPATSGSGYFQDTGTLTVAPNASFAFGRASAISFSVEFNGGTINADQILSRQGAVHLNGPAVSGDFAIIFEAGDNFISGTVGLDQTLWIRGTDGSRASLQITDSITNHGTIRLQNDFAFATARLTSLTDTLINGPSGLIETIPGLGSLPELSVNILNQGEVRLRTDLNFRKSFTNQGTFLLTEGVDLNLEVSNFIQEAGSLVVEPTALMTLIQPIVTALARVELLGGTVSAEEIVVRKGAVHLDGPSVAGDFTVVFESFSPNNVLSGQIAPGQSVWVRGLANQLTAVAITGSLTNHGTIRLQNDYFDTPSQLDPTGQLVNAANGVIEVLGTGSPFHLKSDLLNRGRISLENSRLQLLPGKLTNDKNGLVTGIGEIIVGQTDSFGTIRPGASPGILKFDGGLTLTASSRIEMELTGTTPGTGHDQIQVTGNARLHGTLDVDVVHPFVPAIDDEIVLLTYGSRQSQFATMLGLVLNTNLGLQHFYRPAQFELKAVAIPGDIPGILTQPTDQSVALGGTAEFEVLVEGTPQLLYQWRKNGVNIAGATNAILTITNVQVPDGAAYEALIVNDSGVQLSDPAFLFVTVSALAGADHLTNRVAIGASLVFGSNNSAATREPGEPRHFNKLSSNSVWYSWTPASSGIATIHTRGSVFDTLLAVYTGTNYSDLTEVEGDDERGGFHTSEVQFNASSGTPYIIALDGFAGATGQYIISIELEPTADTLPVITGHPQGLTVADGDSATFEVSATGGSLTYQWLGNGFALEGETNSSYTIETVGATNVASYTVRITNGTGRVVESLPASLEVGDFSGVHAINKLGDLLDPFGGGGGEGQGGGIAVPAIPLSPGTVGAHLYSNVQLDTDLGEDLQCPALGARSARFKLQILGTGTFPLIVENTNDHTRANTHILITRLSNPTTVLGCGLNGNPLYYPVSGPTTYMLWVDGSECDRDSLSEINFESIQKCFSVGLKWSLNPTGSDTFLLQIGQPLDLHVAGLSPLQSGIYEWRFNDAFLRTLAGEPVTGDRYFIPALGVAHAGLYTVAGLDESNRIAFQAAAVNVLQIQPVDGQIQIRGKLATPDWALQVSESLNHWQTVDDLNDGAFDFSDPAPKNFYRVAPVGP